MNDRSTLNEMDWDPLLRQMQQSDSHSLPTYPGDLKTALLQYAELSHHPKAEAVFQLAQEVARLTTPCDPEIVYWFSRLACLIRQ